MLFRSSVHHNAIPDPVGNLFNRSDSAQANDYQKTEGGTIRRVTDGGTEIDLGDDFNDNENKFVSDLTIYPNPLNDVGTISFNLKENAKTVAKIYNLTGSLVKSIDLGMLNKGEHKEQFNATDLSIGSYIVSIESGSERSVTKFIVTR